MLPECAWKQATRSSFYTFHNPLSINDIKANNDKCESHSQIIPLWSRKHIAFRLQNNLLSEQVTLRWNHNHLFPGLLGFQQQMLALRQNELTVNNSKHNYSRK